VEVNSEVYEGFNFGIIGYEQSLNDEINNEFKVKLEYSKEVKDRFSQTIGFSQAFWEDKILVYMPFVDTSQATSFYGTWYFCSNLEFVPQLDFSRGRKFDRTFYYCSKLKKIRPIDLTSATDLTRMFYYCSNLDNVVLNNVQNVTNFSEIFTRCDKLENLIITNWKKSSISLNNSIINTKSIKNIIFHAVNSVDGATNRTLTFGTTSKKIWNNEVANTTPTADDAELLGVTDWDRYKKEDGTLYTWGEIASLIKDITIA
jgi:hypothetical protein